MDVTSMAGPTGLVGPVGFADHRSPLDAMLTTLVEAGGSDLHLTAGAPPTIRVNGALQELTGYGELGPVELEALLRPTVTADKWNRFENDHELDFAYSIGGISRFRVNLYYQRGSCGAAFRVIPHRIKALEELGVPESVARFAALPRGLVLVTGPTGSGKTTTLAALVDLANRTRSSHIVTIEDPIEFLHPHKKCLINQREVGADTASFSMALKHALRQDPDIILVGELRDLETTSTAITAAETGHLVLATLHTQSAPGTIDRIIDVFPAEQQGQIRTQLAASLEGVVTQTLLPTLDGRGRVPALEVLLPDDAVRNLIRQGKVEQIYSVMQTSTSRGMQTIEQSLADLTIRRVIAEKDAIGATSRPDEFKSALERSGFESATDDHLPTALRSLQVAGAQR